MPARRNFLGFYDCTQQKFGMSTGPTHSRPLRMSGLLRAQCRVKSKIILICHPDPERSRRGRICFFLSAGMRSVALPREPEQQSNRDAEPKSSQHKPSANIETDGPHHQETNRDKNSGKLRVHLHHAHNARMAIGVAALHVVNCLTGRCGGPGLLISPCIDNTGVAGRDLNPSDHKMAADSKNTYVLPTTNLCREKKAASCGVLR